MPTKYFKVDLDLNTVNECIEDESMFIRSNHQFLNLFVDELFSVEYLCEFGEDWYFSVVDDNELIRVEIPDNSFTKFKNYDEAFRAFLDYLKQEGVHDQCFTGKSVGRPIGTDWKYTEVTGIAHLMLRKKDFDISGK